jgi:hypothetical protein
MAWVRVGACGAGYIGAVGGTNDEMAFETRGCIRRRRAQLHGRPFHGGAGRERAAGRKREKVGRKVG